VTDQTREGVPDGAITIDADGRVVEVDAAAERLLGAQRAQAVGDEVGRLIGGGGPHILERRMEIPAVAANGAEITVAVHVRQTSVDPARFTAHLRDAAAEHERHAEDARQRALFDSVERVARLGSWEWIPSEPRLSWSDGMYAIFGLAPDEVQPSLDYVFARTHPDDADRVRREVARLGEEGQLAPLDYRIDVPGRGVRHVRAVLAVAETRDGEPYRLIGSVQDVTERRRAEREIAAHVAVAEALAAWDGLQRGGAGLLAGLGEALDCVEGVLWVRDGGELVPRVTWHAGAVDAGELERASHGLRVGPDQALPGRVLGEREPVHLLHSGAVDDARGAAAQRAGLRSAVFIAALAGDEVLAVIELRSCEEIELTERLLRSLTGIAHELGAFLSRRRGELTAPVLTPRELEVLQLSAEGRSARVAAEHLTISPATVRTHLENIYAKLGVSDKASAVATGLRLGVIE
jgi:DNA-binding CsgD family transcriptional regulator/PAS domain-containing protein